MLLRFRTECRTWRAQKESQQQSDEGNDEASIQAA